MLARAIGNLFVRTGLQSPHARRSPHGSLERELTRIAASARGSVGAAALHVETGTSVALNAGARFPLASTVKIPVALQLLSRVDRGELALDALVAIEPRHLRPGAGIIARRFQTPGAALSVRELLELALIVSDNTAADMILELAGGIASVRERVQALGLSDIAVDRTILELLADVEGITPPTDGGVTPERWRVLKAAVPDERMRAADRAFFADSRDTATPEAMTRLLASICRGETLSGEGTSLLLDILARCETGADRLKGMLPSGSRVAHKTGTIDGVPGRGTRYPRVVNDAGIIDLPRGAGHVAMAVCIMGSPGTAQAQANVVARMARAVYDGFRA